MASAEQLMSYHPQCSDIAFSDFDENRAKLFDLGADNYYEDVFKNHGKEGIIVSSLCFFALLVHLVLSCACCCATHYWAMDSDFIGLARKGRRWYSKLFGIVFTSLLLVASVVVIIMSSKGIAKSTSEVKDVVPEAFKFLDRTYKDVHSIYVNLTEAVENGNRLVQGMRDAADALEQDFLSIAPTSDSQRRDIENSIEELRKQTDDVKVSLNRVDEEINDNLEELDGALEDAVGFDDEGDSVNNASIILLVMAFSFFILFSLGATIFSILGTHPRCHFAWATIMWFMLMIAFGAVTVLDVSKELSKDSCLYIDGFAVQELKNQISSDPKRIEKLFWYYFQPAGSGNLTLTELETLWNVPLTEVMEYIEAIEAEFFDGNQIKEPYDLLSNTTQEALLDVEPILPKAKKDIIEVQNLIRSDTFNNIHENFKDLLCCTEYDAINDVWKAWVVSSAFGVLIAILMTFQVFLSFKYGKRPRTSAVIVSRSKTQINTTPYIGPPIQEGYTTASPRKQSRYPTIEPPPVYF